MKILLFWLSAVALIGGSSAHYDIPLAVVGQRPLGFANSLVPVPLMVVPRNELELYSNVHINAVSRTEPLVTCTYNKNSVDALPVVRVVLRQPVLIQGQEAVLPFPSVISVLHEGLRMSMPIGALIAPVPEHFLGGPHFVRTMYAVPTGPLRINYPFYSSSPVPYPFRPEYGAQGHFSKPISVPSVTRPQKVPTPEQPGILHNGKPSNPLVTVLDFPSEIASPASLFYQPPVDPESEFGNRNPPEAIVPAGIVQSAQPRPSLQIFLNSKESPFLQGMRDQSASNREPAGPNSISVESL